MHVHVQISLKLLELAEAHRVGRAGAARQRIIGTQLANPRHRPPGMFVFVLHHGNGLLHRTERRSRLWFMATDCELELLNIWEQYLLFLDHVRGHIVGHALENRSDLNQLRTIGTVGRGHFPGVRNDRGEHAPDVGMMVAYDIRDEGIRPRFGKARCGRVLALARFMHLGQDIEWANVAILAGLTERTARAAAEIDANTLKHSRRAKVFSHDIAHTGLYGCSHCVSNSAISAYSRPR